MRDLSSTLAVRSRWRRNRPKADKVSIVTGGICRPLLFEALEPRILLSADLNPLATTALTPAPPLLRAAMPPAPASVPAQVLMTQAADVAPLDAYIHPASVAAVATVAGTPVPAVSGALSVPGQTQDYRFTLTQPTKLYFDSFTNSNALLWSLTGPRGAEVINRGFASADAGGAYSNTRPVLDLLAGDYTLTVGGQGAATGDYAFALRDFSNPPALAFNTPVSGTLNPGNSTAAYQFTAAAGQRVFINPQAGSGIYYKLIGPANNQAGNTGSTNSQALTLPMAGVYTLLLEGVVDAAAPQNYVVGVYAQNDTAQTMTVGSTVNGAVSVPDQSNTYTFALTAQTKLLFDSLTQDNSLFWTLTGPRGAEVPATGLSASDSYYGPSNPLLDLPAGAYTLTLAGTGSHIGAYAFRLLDVAGATAIGYNSAVNGTLASPGRETRLYAFTAAAGDQVNLNATQAGGLYQRLYDPFGALVSSGNLQTTTTQTLRLSGTYTLAIEGQAYNTGAASFTVTVAKTGNVVPTALTGTALTLGTPVSGTFAANSATVDAVFTVTQATRLLFVPLVTPYATGLRASWQIDGPQGVVFASTDFYTHQYFTAVPGTYRVRVTAGGTDAGQKFAYVVDDLAAAAPIAYDTTVNGTLATGTGAAIYKFAATKGDVVYFNAPTGINATYVLIDPYGTRLPEQNFGQNGPYTLAQSGTYTLVIEGRYSAGSAAQPFAFTLARVVNGARALTPNAVVNGTLTRPGQTDRYTFSLASAAAVYMDALTQDTNVQWSMTGPDGTLAGSAGLYAGGNKVLALGAGSYTVSISASGAATGAYAFQLLDLGTAAVPLALGATVSAAPASPFAARAYRFSATAGDRVTFNARASSDNNLGVQIVDPFGRLLVPRQSFVDLGATALPYAGTYTVIIDSRAYYDTTVAASFVFDVTKIVDQTTALAAIDGPPILGPLSATLPSGAAATQFTGAESITVPNGAATDLRTTVTLEAWINPQTYPNNTPWTALFYKGDGTFADNARTYALFLNSGGFVYLSTQDAQGDAAIQTASGSVALNAWTHVAAVIDRTAGTLAIYLNGVLSVSGTVRKTPANGGAYPLTIGASQEGFETYEGGMADVALFGTARTASQIAADYAAPPAPGTPGLRLLLPLAGAAVGLTPDLSPSAVQATITSTAAGLPGTITGRIAMPGQTRTYTVTLATPQRLVFDGLVDNDQFTVTLKGPDGFSVSRNLRNGDSYEWGGGSPVIDAPAGAYTITVTEAQNRTDIYAFRFVSLANAQPLTLGTPVTVTQSASTQAYVFTASAGQKIYLDLRSLSRNAYDGDFRLLDPYGNQVFGPSNLQDVGTTVLATGGPYTLLLEARTYQSQPLTVSFAVDAVFDATTPLTLGVNPAAGPLRIAGPNGLRGLRLTGAETVSVPDAPALHLNGNVTMETWLRVDRMPQTWTTLLYKGAATNGDGSGRVYSLWLNSAGFIYLGTSDANGSQGVQTAAGLIAPGTWYHIAGVIDRVGGTARIYINGVDVANAAVRASLAPASTLPLLLGATQETNPAYSNLQGSLAGVALFSTARDASQIGTDYRNGVSAGAAGLALYLPFSETSGSAAADSSANHATATLTAQNASGITGQIATPGQTVSYTFTLGSAASLYFDSLMNDPDFYWTLTGPRGVVVNARQIAASDANRANPLLTLVAGDYTLSVTGGGDTTGFFNIRLLPLSVAAAITPGTAFAVSLAPGNAARVFGFAATAGQRVFLDATDYHGGNVFVRLLDPDGRDVFGAQSASNLPNLGLQRLLFTGTYTLLVDADAYYDPNLSTVTLNVVPYAPLTSALAPNAVVSGMIGAPGQTASYTFTLAAATRGYFDSFTQSGALNWTLTGPAGTVVAARGFNQSDSYDQGAPVLDLSAGAYTLTVRAQTDQTGAFSFSLLDFAGAVALAPGIVRADTAAPRATRLYAFTGTANQRVLLTTATAAGDVAYRLIAPTGQILYGPTGAGAQYVTLPVAGSYVLAAEGRVYGSAASSFSVQVTPVTPVNSAAVAQTFDAAGLPYVLTQYSGATPAAIVGGGPTGSLLRLGYSSSGNLYNRVTADFQSTGGGSYGAPAGVPFGSATVAFDALIAETGANRVGGIAAAILPVQTYGFAGPSFDVNTTSYPGALGVRLSLGNAVDGSADTVTLVWDGQTIATVAAGLNLNSGASVRVAITLTAAQGGANVSVTLTPAAGAARTVIAAAFVGGFFPDTFRTAIGADTGYAAGSLAIDNVAVGTTVGAAIPALALGATQSGALATTASVDRYQFTLTKPTGVVFDSLTNAYFTWSLTGNGVTYGNRYFNQSDSASLGTSPLIALPPGTYTLAISGAQQGRTGAYAFRMLDVAAATKLDLTAGSAVVTGTLDPGAETAVYAFTVAAGQTIDVSGVTGWTGYQYFRVLDPNGAQIVGPTPLYANAGPFTATAAGTYTLLLEGSVSAPSPANYGLTVNIVTDVAKALTLNTIVTGAVTQPGQQIVYTFTQAAASRLFFDALSVDSSLKWTLTGPDGAQIDAAPFNYNDRGPYAVRPGMYTLTVSQQNADGHTGPFSFRLLDLATAGATLTPGTGVSGTLDPGNGAAVYRFTGAAGQKIYFDGKTVSGNPSWAVYDPAGNPLFGNPGLSPQAAQTLALDGIYTVLIQGYLYQTTPASFTLNIQPVATSVSALILGAVTNGAIPSAGAQARYTFTLPQATRIVLAALQDQVDQSYNGALGWTLTGPSGVVASRALNNSDGTWFGGSASPALSLAAGAYTLTFGASGDQTGTFAFRLTDLAAAAPLTLGSPVTGTLTPGSDTRAYTFTAEAGAMVYPQPAGGSTANAIWRLIGPANTQVFYSGLSGSPGKITLPYAGTYTLLVEGYIGDAASTIGYGFTVYADPAQAPIPLGGLGGVAAPDLVVRNLTVTAAGGTVRSGAALSIGWSDANTGSAVTDASWTDRVIVKRADTGAILANVTVPYDASARGALAGGASAAQSVTIRLPDGNPGAGALIVSVTTDSANTVSEQNAGGSGYSNNTGVLTFTSALAAYPDLTVSDVTLTPATGFAAGASVTANWIIKNTGNAAVTVPFAETVSVRNTQTGAVIVLQTDTVASPVAAGGSLARSASFAWPAGISSTGLFEVDVTADSAGVVTEAVPFADRTDNVGVLTLRSAPDLVIAGFAVTNAGPLRSGQTVTLGWTDTNGGNASTPGTFTDRVRVVNTSTGALLLDVALDAGGPLAAGASRARTASFALPNGAPGVGALSITVTLDQATSGQGSMQEAPPVAGANPRGNNASTITATSSLALYPDLRTTATVPAAAAGGGSIAVSWTVTNAGAGATQATSWTDSVILSTTPVLGAASDIVLGTVTHTGALAANASYSVGQGFALPATLSGTYYVTVVADSTQAVLEPSGRAATVSAPHAVAVASSYATLTVTGVTAPANASAGATVLVQWTVRNAGAGGTNVASWRDRVVLSRSTTVQPGDTVLGTLTHSGAVGPGGTYAGSLTVTLPSRVSGAYRIIVVPDADAQVYQAGQAGVSGTAPVAIQSPHLTVSTVGAPTAAQPGQRATITWTVRNTGAGDASGVWTDRVLVSADGTLANAITLAEVTHANGLAAGASYGGTAAVTLPALPDGTAVRFFVVTDAYGAVFEATGAARSGTSAAVAITHADLAVTAVVAPATAVAGTAVTVSWTVKDQGSAAAMGGWTDQVFASASGQLDGAAVYLGSLPQAGPLAAGASYARMLNVTLPATLAGSYRILVRTNAAGINEAGYGANGIGASPPISISPPPVLPALQVQNLVLTPATGLRSGGTLAIGWIVANTGLGAGATSFYTHVRVQNTTTGAVLLDRDVFYDTAAAGPIAAGGGKAQGTSLILPDGAPGVGSLKVTITADAYTQVFEGSASRSGLVATATVASTLAAYADLGVRALTVAPAAPVSGGTLTVTWSDANAGDAAVTRAFADRVTIVNQTTGATIADQRIGYDPAVSGAIAAGAALARSFAVTLPAGMAGTGALVVRVTTDADSLVPEAVSPRTNNSASLSVTSTLATYPDLAVSNVTVPADAAAGGTFAVSYTLTNRGTAPASGTWIDALTLSPDGAAAREVPLQTFAEVAQTIAAGASVTRTVTVTLPPFAGGAQFIAVSVDPQGALTQLDRVSHRGVSAAAVAITPGLTVDLGAATLDQVQGATSSVGTVTRSGGTASAVTVVLASGFAGLRVPSSVIIAAGQSAATFAVTAINTGLAGPTRTVTVSASASGYSTGTGTLSETDSIAPALSLALPGATVNRSAGAVIATLTRNTPTAAALTVTLTSTLSFLASVPPTVTFAAGQSSVAVPITLIDDGFVYGDLTAGITATAAGLATASAQLAVTDTNLPVLTLTPGQSTLSEAAGANATSLKITRSVVTSQPLLITLGSMGGVSVPATVTIGAGQSSVTIPVGVSNFGKPTSSVKTAMITAFAADPNYGRSIPRTQSMLELTIIGSVGPTLTLTPGATTISGTASTTATIARAAGDTTQPLTVRLTSSNPAEATVPATVTFAPGQASASFVIAGVNDGSLNGSANVTVTATATGYAQASAGITVSNQNLPDLAVQQPLVPGAIVSGQTAQITYSVKNQGRNAASGPWTDKVYVSKNPILNADAVLVGTFTHTALAAGGSYTQTLSFTAGAPGTLYAIVVSDTAGAVPTVNAAGKTRASVGVSVTPAFTATVAASTHAAPAGSPVTLSGTATSATTGLPEQVARVQITLINNGFSRTLSAVAGFDGKFSIVFKPVGGESGDYTVSAAQPGATPPAAQDRFTLTGMTASVPSVSVTGLPGQQRTGTFTLTNTGSVALTGLTATLSGLPATAALSVAPIASIGANGTVTVAYSFISSAAITGSSTLVIRSAEGAVIRVPFDVSVLPLRANLVTNPGFLSAGMVRGTQSQVSFTVTNTGGADSGPLTVSLPNFPWLSLVTPATIGSIASGRSATVSLLLSPAAGLALQQYSGAIAINGADSSVTQAFNFRAVSTAVGDLTVGVSDEYTFFAANKPPLAGATVTLTDPYTYAVVQTAVTDATGQVHFIGVAEGDYQMTLTAPQHAPLTTAVHITPGIDTALNEFMHRQAVSYTWTVVPVQQADHYQITLQADFQTAVPMPVVTVDQPLVIPFVQKGHTTTFNLTYTNHGLIDANNLTITPPSDPDYVITPLVDFVAVLPAMSSITIPFTIRFKSDSPFVAAQGLAPSAVSAAVNAESGGAIYRQGYGSALLSCLGVKTTYDYICVNHQIVAVPVTVAAIGCAEDAVGAAQAAAESAILSGNLLGASCNAIDTAISCLNASGLTNISACVQALITGACGAAFGAAAGGPAGAVAGALSAAGSDILACLCDLFGGSDFGNGGTVSLDGGGGFGGGGTGGGGYAWGMPIGFDIPSAGPCASVGSSAVTTADGGAAGVMAAAPMAMGGTMADLGVCASVRLEIDQRAVVTRTAFRGTLAISDGTTGSPLSDVRVTLDIRDMMGNAANDMFLIQGPTTSNVSGAANAWVIAANSTGTLFYTFVPTTAAAVDMPTMYMISGTLHYVQDGVAIDVPLSAASVTVYPEAQLQLNYFWQRDVIGDDPFTPPVEASEPFYLGLRVTNVGKGSADDLTITSAQPKIIENEKGLLVDFHITGSTVQDHPGTDSLTVDLGSIDPGRTVTADWALLSSLQGHFKNFSASFKHTDDGGSLRTSLIQSVNIHELIRVVHLGQAVDGGVPSFLSSDTPNPNHDPDTLYIGNGGQAHVSLAQNAAFTANADGTRTLTAQMAAGWSYISIANPLPGQKLLRVTRSDGTVLPLDGMVWTTDRTFPEGSPGALDDNLIHLLDKDSSGTYTLTFVSDDGTAPHITAVQDLSATVQVTGPSTLDVSFSKPVDPSTLTPSVVSLTRNGASVVLSGITFTALGGGGYRVGGLAAFTAANGNYVVTINGTRVADMAGNAGDNVVSSSFAVSSGAVILTSVSPVASPRTTPNDAVVVSFSAAINPATFTQAALSLSRDGVPITIDGRVSVIQITPTTFRIGGLGTLTATDGGYALTIDGALVTDTSGNAVTGKLTAAWVLDTVAPVVTAIEPIATNPRNTVVPSLTVTLSEAIDPATFDYRAITLMQNGGANLITAATTVTRVDDTHYKIANFGNEFSAVTGINGTYVITVKGATLRDRAGNAGTGSVSESYVLNVTAPDAPSGLTVTPDRGTSATDGITNTLSISLTGTVTSATYAVRVTDVTTGQELGYGVLTGKAFAAPFTLSGPGTHTLRARTIDTAGNTADAFLSVFVDLVQPSVISIDAPASPTVTPVDGVRLTLSKPISGASFTAADLSLTRSGVAVALGAGVTLTDMGANMWALGGLSAYDAAPGNYVLTVTASGLADVAGNTGTGSLSQAWTQTGTTVTGSVSGTVFDDRTGSGVIAADDVGLRGWTVYLDVAGTGAFAAGDPSAVTAADGSYTIAGVAPGMYTIGIVQQAGHVATHGTSGMIDVVGGAVTGAVDFGEFKLATIDGALFDDANANGARDGAEPPLADRTVFLDLTGDGVLRAADPRTVTAADGSFHFTGVGPGTVTVRQLVVANHVTTTASAPVTVLSGAAIIAAIGDVTLASVSGTVFVDVNGDGARQSAETGLQGVTVFLDTNGDGQFETGKPSTVTAADGTYTFAGLLPGQYAIGELLPPGYVETTPGAAQAATSAASGIAIHVEQAPAAGHASTSLADANALTGLGDARARAAYGNLYGQGQTTVVIDTGINANPAYFAPGQVVYQWDFATNSPIATDTDGHGSNVASVIGSNHEIYPGVAPQTKLIVLDVFDANGNGTFAYVLQALQWVAANAAAYHIGVVNMSFGDGLDWTTNAPRYGLGPVLAQLAASHIITVAAAGNNYAQYQSIGLAYPAADPSVVSVGSVWAGDLGGPYTFAGGAIDATTAADQIAAYSQRDPLTMTTFAPGSPFTGAGANGGSTTLQGTSQAAAYVSGAATLAQQLAERVLGRDLTTGEFAALLRATGDRITDPKAPSAVYERLDFVRLFDAISAMAGTPAASGGGTGAGGTAGGGTVATASIGAPGYVHVTLSEGQAKTGADFGDFKLGSIAGTVTPVNGRPASGVSVILDRAGTGAPSAGILRTTTDAAGRYSFADVGPGTFTVRVEPPTGSSVTPAGGVMIAMTSGLAAVASFTLAAPITPVVPTVIARGSAANTAGQPYALTLDVTNPGAGFAWAIAWGDGTTSAAAGNAKTATHTYASGGKSYTIVATGTDVNGSYATTPITVVVAKPVTPVVATVTAIGGATAAIGQAYTLTLGVTNPGANFAWSVAWGDGTTSTAGGNAVSATHTYAAGGKSYVIVATGTDANGAYVAAAVPVAVPPPLRVASVTQDASGVRVRFSGVIAPASVHLYGTQGDMLGAPTVTLVGNTTGAVSGSLIFDADLSGFTFVRTGGPLTPDSYTLTLLSGAGAFHDALGGLDGKLTGVPGSGAFTTTITVPAAPGGIASLPDFVRAPGQPVNYAIGGSGLPLTIAGAAGLTSATLRLTYDPLLLSITGLLAGSVPAGVTVTVTVTTPGLAMVTVAAPAGLGAGPVTIGALAATIPATAAYGARTLIGVGVDAAAGAALRGDDAVQVVGLLGDVSGNGRYDAADAPLVQRAIVRLDTGFAAWPDLDPVILADVARRGALVTIDATRIAQAAAGIVRPEIPPAPAAPYAVAPAVPIIGFFAGAVPASVSSADRAADDAGPPDTLHRVKLARRFKDFTIGGQGAVPAWQADFVSALGINAAAQSARLRVIL